MRRVVSDRLEATVQQGARSAPFEPRIAATRERPIWQRVAAKTAGATYSRRCWLDSQIEKSSLIPQRGIAIARTLRVSPATGPDREGLCAWRTDRTASFCARGSRC